MPQPTTEPTPIEQAREHLRKAIECLSRVPKLSTRILATSAVDEALRYLERER